MLLPHNVNASTLAIIFPTVQTMKIVMQMKSSIIVTERLYLRKWVDSDFAPFVQMNKDPDVMEYFPAILNDSETLTMINRINLSFDKNNFGLFAIEHKSTGRFLGFTGFSVPQFETFFTPCIEIGWRYNKESWGQGFVTEAAKACLVYGFETLGFTKIVSFTSSINKKSVDVMKRIGMKYVTDFNHPKIDESNRLCRHLLYEITNEKPKSFVN
jgi:RimJ/RimL family protein N-acetyltransferase